MIRRKSPMVLAIASALLCLTWGSGQARAENSKDLLDKGKKAHAARLEAAKRLRALGLKPGVAGLKVSTGAKATATSSSVSKKTGLRAAVPGAKAALPPNADPGGTPHYFGPYGNWAYSPLPKGPVVKVTLTAPGAGYSNPLVTIDDVYGTGASVTFPATQISGAVQPITVPPLGIGADFSAPIATITDDPTQCGGGTQPACGTGATADAVIGGTLTGGIAKFVDPLPVPYDPKSGGATPTKAIPLAVPDVVSFPGNDYYEIALRPYSEKFHRDLPATKLLGYVQTNFGTDTSVCGGAAQPPCDSSHNTIKPADIRYLGPTIVGAAHRPIRIKFSNELPTGAKDATTGRRPGDLFIPVDETVPGSGFGPAVPGSAGETFTQNRAAVHLHGNNTVWISDGTPHQWIAPAGETTSYPQGASVYNVPDMWFDSANGFALIPGATNTQPTPTATNDPGPGKLTLYYTNAMSARLMFYHDHAMGITRLNVYAGEAAGYLLYDQVDLDLITGSNGSGVNPTGLKVLPDIGIPLVIQDKTFVDAATIAAQDPTWNWGTGAVVGGNITDYVTGDLWVPHVYMSAQNPWDLGGMNAFGRWHYGPWFTPPTPACTAPSTPAGCIEVGPVANVYHQTDCDLVPPGPGCTAPWEPPFRPGVPNPSIPGEAFNDTPIVNGAAYPYIEVEPRAYRFRILSAANDRFLNLQLYKAYTKDTFDFGTGSAHPPTATVPCPTNPLDPAVLTTCTEVKMIPVGGAPNQSADTPSGIPDPATAGPNWWQIATEGGWLAAPVDVPQQPVGWNMDPTAFNVGVVNQHSLLLGSAERADVIVDFTGYEGQTLILYNDAPAAFPAGVPTYDYYTGVANQMDVGGAPMTQPGYGPNTRTIMQIRVKNVVPTIDTSQVTWANLQAVWAKNGTKRGVFEATQDTIIVPQAAYGSAYESNQFPKNASQYLHIPDTQMTFSPIEKQPDGSYKPAAKAVTLPLQMKAMHDEMGGVYDTQFGRMSGMLGLTNPQRGNAFLIPFGYASPPTDVVMISGDVNAAPVGSLADGTQIWRIFHNGVDTHTIHTHLFTSQLINRIGQDNWMVDPEPAEFGWKDTFRINPLEVTFLAMKPIIPTQQQLPFEVPDSVRLIDPTLPQDASLIEPPPAGWFDPAGLPITQILNHTVNFGWEYVWHCHILAHEEMDMMHSLVGAAPPMAPTGFQGSVTGTAANPTITLTWTDNSRKEKQFRIERATDAQFATGLTKITYVNPVLNPTPNLVTYVDKGVAPNNQYWYRLIAEGYAVGDTWVYPGSIGFPTMTANSLPVLSSTNPLTIGAAAGPDAPPTTLTFTLQAGPAVRLAWKDNATNETGFAIERCTLMPDTSCPFAQIAVAPAVKNTGNTSFVDSTVTPGYTYRYQVAAINGVGASAYAGPTADVAVPAIPAAPTGFTVSLGAKQGNNYPATLKWTDNAINETNFTIQRATNALFTTGLTTSTPAALAGSGSVGTSTQNLPKNTTYYFRIRANNSISGSSAWATALPFPIRTGP